MREGSRCRYVEDFIRDGYVVVDGVISPEAVEVAIKGFDQSLASRGLDVSTAGRLSSTKAGGVLDLFYEPWKLELTLQNKKYADIYCELLQATYGTCKGLWAHPFGELTGGCWPHVDRVGLRRPAQTTNIGKKNERGLAPHLDCCPYDMHPTDATRWRPIQCLLSLSGGEKPDEGGFETIPGFHREFDAYFEGTKRPRVGEFVAINTKDDAELLKRFKHVRVPPGAALFWDRRLPHANARRNNSTIPRRVVYGGFLPKGPELNRQYAMSQLDRCKRAIPQPDFWIHGDDHLASPTQYVDYELVKRRFFSSFDRTGPHAAA